MEPTLVQGDRITIEGIEPSRLRRGDIVVYDSPLAGLVVHRLIWTVPPVGAARVAFTKGDALLHLDRPFSVQDVLGRVVEIERTAAGRPSRRRLGGWRGRARWLAFAAAWGWRNGIRGMGRKALTHQEKR